MPVRRSIRCSRVSAIDPGADGSFAVSLLDAEDNAVFFGIGFDLNIFTALFGEVAKIGGPVRSSSSCRASRVRC